MTIKNFKTIIISKFTQAVYHGDPGTTFSIPIFLQFVPTYFILRLASYSIISNLQGNTTILLLKTSLLNNEAIFSLTRTGLLDSGNIQLDTKFKMNPSVISGNYDFTLCDIFGSSVDNFGSMQIALTMEFVEEI